jgi:hypothetical protein
MKMIRLPDRSEWEDGIQPNRKGAPVLYTDGSQTNEGTGAKMYGYGTRRNLSFSFGQYTTMLQCMHSGESRQRLWKQKYPYSFGQSNCS